MRPKFPAFVAAAGCLVPFASVPAQHNVLLVVADDLGVDRVGVYAEHPNPGRTPVIDQLAAEGILFRNVWANPVCSPTRATLLTGRYAFRDGIGTIILYDEDDEELPIQTLTLPKLLAPVYESAAIGKWHLTSAAAHGTQHPHLSGFEHFSGSMQSFLGIINDAYYGWDKCKDGVVNPTDTYATTDSVDDALNALARMEEPWLLYLSFHAPHTPFHKPPQELHTFSLPSSVQGNIPVHMQAMTQAMDTEFGRLLSSMDPAVRANTVIIFVGDNGTDSLATTPPFVKAHAKGTLFEGGINVPLIISGPGIVAGEECAALVNTTDLFATIAELAARPQSAEDSVSLVPYFTDPNQPSLRDWVYAEVFAPNGFGIKPRWERTVRDARFKYMHNELGTNPEPVPRALFDLHADPFEQDNLLAQPSLAPDAAAALASLQSVLDALRLPPWTDIHHGLAGSIGVPSLQGEGELLPASPVTVTLSGAARSAPTLLAIGFSTLFAPYKGGVFVPVPDVQIGGFVTDTAGELQLSTTWPAGLPAKFPVYLQAWIADPTSSSGVAASNALLSITP